jgi:hypothetical protein
MHPDPLRNRQGPLAHDLENQVTRAVAVPQRLHDGDARIAAVAGETGTAAYENSVHHGRLPILQALQLQALMAGNRMFIRLSSQVRDIFIGVAREHAIIQGMRTKCDLIFHALAKLALTGSVRSG